MRSDAGVLFDLDGVIVDSREHHLPAWQQLCREAAIEAPEGYFTRTFGLRNDAIIGGLVPRIDAAELRRLAERKEEIFRERARGRLRALPGVAGLLAGLDAASIPKAVVTSTPRANLDMILDDLTLRSHFQALVAEEDAAKGKPDPEGFLVAARRIGIAPHGCVVIEDAPHGLEAAKRAGMRTIGVTTTHARPALAAADLIVDSLADAAAREFVLG